MTSHTPAPLLPRLWNRIKQLFGHDHPQNHTAPHSKLYWRKRFLERCLQEDCEVEATRKQLERLWEDVSS